MNKEMKPEWKDELYTLVNEEAKCVLQGDIDNCKWDEIVALVSTHLQGARELGYREGQESMGQALHEATSKLQ